jgi:hypothetical protein
MTRPRVQTRVDRSVIHPRAHLSGALSLGKLRIRRIFARPKFSLDPEFAEALIHSPEAVSIVIDAWCVNQISLISRGLLPGGINLHSNTCRLTCCNFQLNSNIHYIATRAMHLNVGCQTPASVIPLDEHFLHQISKLVKNETLSLATIPPTHSAHGDELTSAGRGHGLSRVLTRRTAHDVASTGSLRFAELPVHPSR